MQVAKSWPIPIKIRYINNFVVNISLYKRNIYLQVLFFKQVSPYVNQSIDLSMARKLNYTDTDSMNL